MVNDPKSDLQDFVASLVETSSGDIIDSSEMFFVCILFFPQSKTSPCCFAPSQPKQTQNKVNFYTTLDIPNPTVIPKGENRCEFGTPGDGSRGVKLTRILTEPVFAWMSFWTKKDELALASASARPVCHCSHCQQILLSREWHDSRGVLEPTGKRCAAVQKEGTVLLYRTNSWVLLWIKRKVLFTTAICFGYLRI